MTVEILHGDARAILPTLEAESFHASVCDPPYHLHSLTKRFANSPRSETTECFAAGPYKRHSKGFMGKTWDGGDVAFLPETWTEVWRVLKPGAYLVAFASCRGYHRMACAIEDSGFWIHPMLGWIFASGFPKAHRVDAEEWEGWRYGMQSLKPAIEPICLAQKPFSEPTGTANVLRHGTGALNIDASRIPVTDATYAHNCSGDHNHADNRKRGMDFGMGCGSASALGRWPANVCHDGSPEVMDAFARFGESKSSGGKGEASQRTALNGEVYGEYAGTTLGQNAGGLGDVGTAARFFFCAKADASERVGNHPTVKPIALMEWLVQLVTPPGGRVLDPFCGTGSTLVACDRLGFEAVGIEQDAQTVADAHEKIRRFRARRAIGDAPSPPIFEGQLRLFT